MFPPENILHKNFVEGRYGRTSRFGCITKNLQNCFSKPCLFTKCNGENKFGNLNMIDAQNKRLKWKYEVNTGLPLGEGS
jgi:hypothetical protein